MYSIHDYGDMLADRGRMDAYAAALRTCVTHESVVADLGAGPGVLTLLACRAGARKVYAIEPDGVLQVAREIVAANGYADRVEFIEAMSVDVQLPEQVDVIVSDVHGVLPFFGTGLSSLIDARRRFLKPGGRLVPHRDVVYATLLAAPESRGAATSPWTDEEFDFGPARDRAMNLSRKMRAEAAQVAVEPVAWATVDYASIDDPSGGGAARWTIDRPLRIGGLCLWFDSVVAPGIEISNSPRAAERHVYGQMFLSWPERLELVPESTVAVTLRADAVGEDYVLSWSTEAVRPGLPVVQWRQSEFYGNPVSADWLRKGAASFVPRPSRDAEIDKRIVEGFFAGNGLDTIARDLVTAFPDRFREWRTALTRVAALSLKYSK